MPGILVPSVLWLAMAFAVGFKVGDIARSQKRSRLDPNPPDQEDDFRTFHEHAVETSRDGKSRMYRLCDDDQSFELIDVQSPQRQKNS